MGANLIIVMYRMSKGRDYLENLFYYFTKHNVWTTFHTRFFFKHPNCL